MKRYSLAPIIREKMQIKTINTMSYRYAPIGMAKIKKIKNTKGC